MRKGERLGQARRTHVQDCDTPKQPSVVDFIVFEQDAGVRGVGFIRVLRTLQQVGEHRDRRAVVTFGVHLDVGNRTDGKYPGGVLSHGINESSSCAFSTHHKLWIMSERFLIRM